MPNPVIKPPIDQPHNRERWNAFFRGIHDALPGVTDHGSLAGLTDDDHTQYILVDGTRPFTGGVLIDGSADETQLTVQGNSTQTSELFVVENSATLKLLSIDGGGVLVHQPTSLSSSVFTVKTSIGAVIFNIGQPLGTPTVGIGSGGSISYALDIKANKPVHINASSGANAGLSVERSSGSGLALNAAGNFAFVGFDEDDEFFIVSAERQYIDVPFLASGTRRLGISGGDGSVNIGPSTPAGDGLFKIETSTTWGVQALTIDQNDTDKPFIDFQGAVGANTTNSISSLTTSGATTHHLQCELNGTKLWVAASTNNPS